MSRQQTYPIRAFRPVSSLDDTADKGVALEQSKNILLRPQGGWSGPPVYGNLWAIGVAATVQATYRALPYYPVTGSATTADAGTDVLTRTAHGLVVNDAVQFATTGTLPGGLSVLTTYYVKTTPTADTYTLSATLGGATLDITSAGSGTHSLGVVIGDTSARRTANKTVAIQINRQGKHFLLFYDLTATEERACRGFFYLGDDATYTSGAYTFTTGTPTYTVLAVGLNAAARWYGYNNQGAWFLGNGVDDCVIVQLGRTATPGIWRKAASNTVPGTPVVSLTSPANSVNSPASITKPGVTPFVVVDFGAANTIRIPGKNIVEGTRFDATASTGTLPGITVSPFVMTVAQAYFAYDCVYDANTNSTTCKLYTDDDPFTPLDFTDAGTGDHQFFDPGSFVGTPADFIVRLNADFVEGAAGNGIFKMELVSSTDPIATYSTLSGAGTVSNPYIYTVYTGATNNSLDDVVAFVNSDSKVLSFLTASQSASSAVQLYGFGPYTFGNGSGSGVSEGFTSRTVTIYARYWDPGHDGHGYEGPCSTISNTVIIADSANNDLSVSITPDPTAEGGRFPYIRLYMQFGEDEEAVWKLVTPDSPIANTSGVKTQTIGTNTDFGDEDMSANQNRPLPHKFTVFQAEQTFRAGLPDHPERLYASKIATADEIAPEGCSLLADDYETVAIPGTPAGSRDVTALLAPESRLEIHTIAGLVLLDPTDLSKRVYPQSSAGAINASAVTLYEGKDMYYWAADLQLRSMSVQRPSDFASTVATSQFAALGSLDYLRQYLDKDTLLRSPERVWVFPDSAGQHIWMFAPSLATGDIIGFAYDLLNKGIVGPFDYPKIYATAAMEPGRPEIIFADEAGRLFVWDTSDQPDSGGNAFGTQAAFTPYSTGTAMPAAYNGYGSVDYDHDQSGSASRFYQAHEAVLETAMLDFGQPAQRKAFQSAIWRTIQDSRAFVEVSFIDLAGNVETFVYGDVNDATTCRASLMLPDTACRVKLRIIGAEMKKWAMRDLSILWTPQGRV